MQRLYPDFFCMFLNYASIVDLFKMKGTCRKVKEMIESEKVLKKCAFLCLGEVHESLTKEVINPELYFWTPLLIKYGLNRKQIKEALEEGYTLDSPSIRNSLCGDVSIFCRGDVFQMYQIEDSSQTLQSVRYNPLLFRSITETSSVKLKRTFDSIKALYRHIVEPVVNRRSYNFRTEFPIESRNASLLKWCISWKDFVSIKERLEYGIHLLLIYLFCRYQIYPHFTSCVQEQSFKHSQSLSVQGRTNSLSVII
jgi:hypothetical protein